MAAGGRTSDWILKGDALHHETALLARYAPDLAKDPVHRWLSRYHWLPIVVVGIVLLAIGGWPCLLWGIFLRTTLGLHATWLVNSATHMWGSRRFETRDESRNTVVGCADDAVAKAGTTTIMPIPSPRAMALPGTRSIPTTTASGC